MKTFLKTLNQLVLKTWKRIQPRFKNIAYLLLLEMGVSLVAAILINMIFTINSGVSLTSLMASGNFNPEMLSSMFFTPGMAIAVVLSAFISLLTLMLDSFISLAFLVAIRENVEISFKKIIASSKKKYWIYFVLFLIWSSNCFGFIGVYYSWYYFSYFYFAVPFIVIDTNVTNGAALKASWNLVKNHKGIVAGNLFVWTLLVAVVSIILNQLDPIGQIVQIVIPIFTLAFNYELYLSLKKAPQVETPESPTESENPQTSSESLESQED